MRLLTKAVWSSTLLSLACGGRPPATRCRADSDCPASARCSAAGLCQELFAISIVDPSGPVATSGVVQLRAVVEGGVPDKLEVLRDGTSLAELKSPFTYTWSTATETEGPHVIVFRGTLGASTAESAPLTITVDRTPPTVASLLPLAGDQNVDVRAPIRLVASEPLVSANLASSVVFVGNGGVALGKSVELSPDDGRTLTIRPAVLPPTPSTLAVALTSGLTDRAGNVLSLPSPWSWTAPSWRALTGASGLVFDPATGMLFARHAISATGKLYAAWVEFSPTVPGLTRVGTFDGTAWTRLGGDTLNLDPAARADFLLSLALPRDGGDRPVVAWTEQTSGIATLYVKQWDGAAWQTLGGALNIAAADAQTPDVALDAAGNPYVAFIEGSAAPRLLYVRRWTGASWQTVGGQLNVDVTKSVTALDLALSPTDVPIIAFAQEVAPSGRHLFVRQYTGGAWSPVLGGPLNVGTGSADWVSLVVDGEAPVVAWQQATTGRDVVYVKRWGGATWQALGADAVNTDPTRDALVPSLALLGPERYAVLWTDFGTLNDVRVSSWSGSGSGGGTAWTPLGDPVRSSSAVPRGTSIAVTPDGAVNVVYLEGSFALSRVFAKQHNR